MGQDINWGGGSGAADALNDILTQRKMEARQAFLDQLTQQNMQSEMAYRAEQAASLKDRREADAELKRAQAGAAMIKPLHIGQEVSDDTVARAKRLGVESSFSQPQPALPDDWQGPLDEGQTRAAVPSKYLGSPDDQKNADILKRQMTWLNSEEGSKLPEPVRAQMLFDAASGRPMAIPAGDWSTAGKAAVEKHSPEWIEYQDYAADVKARGGTPVTFDAYATMDANRKKPAPVSMQFLPNFSGDPNAPAGYNRNPRTGQLEPVTLPPTPSKPLQEVGKGGWGPVVNGKAVTPESFNEASSTQGNSAQPKVELTRPPAAAKTGAAGKPYDTALLKAVQTARTIATPKAPGEAVDPRATASLDQAINNLYESVRDPELKQTVRQIVADPKTAGLTTAQIMQHIVAANPGLSIDAQAALTDLLSAVRNK